jgi:hypothetical protein
MSYKAFISYSHAADGQLAPRLQSGLQRIAKPFYQLRAMRIFRDETSLHLTPALWPMIKRAIGESENFILMASRDAAASQWVQSEVGEWLSLRDGVPEKFYIVLTEGEVVWDDKAKDFDWDKTTALPEGLRGKFESEPFYLDFRWARTAAHLSLRNPKFLNSIGKLAAALRDEPLDIIIGEDVRQHRVFKMAAGVTILLLSVLLAAASYAAYFANERRKETDAAREGERIQRDQAVAARGEAEKRRGEAESSRDEAVRQQGIAETQKRVADEQRKEAEKQTGIALEQRNRAEEQTRIAEERRQEAERQRKAAEEARDEAAYQLAETLADRAEEQSAPGNDIVQALHLASRAAAVSPAGRPETSLHVARVLHMAASLPRVLNLEKADARLLSGALDGDLKYLLATTGDYKLGLWDARTGRRAPLPFDPDTKVGREGDIVTGDGYVKWDSLEFSPGSGLAKAVFNDDTAWSQTLWVWKPGADEKLAEVQLEETQDEIAFSAEGHAVIGKRHYCNKESKEAEGSKCCRTVLWQADKSAPPAELAEPCKDTMAEDEDKTRQLIYRGMRPVLVEEAGDRYGGQHTELTGKHWVTFGMSRDGKAIAAISIYGQVSLWDSGAKPLVREWNLSRNPLASRIVADGGSLLMLTRDGRLIQQKFDGAQIWSAPVAGGTGGTELKGGRIWNTADANTYLVAYRLEEDENSDGWLDLWKLGESRPRKHMPFSGGPVSDLVLLPNQSGGIVEIWGEEEHNSLSAWSFSSKRSQRVENMKTLGSVVKGFHLGITRDGKVLLEGDERELRFVDPVSRAHVFPTVMFSVERGISGKTVAAILNQAHGLRTTARGIAATLPNGQTAELYRDKVGARFEVGDKLVRGTVAEAGHVLSPDGRLMCGIRIYNSGGGRVGSMQDLVVREVETGRIIAGHYRLSADQIVGFTPGNRAVLVQDYDGSLTELYVHGGHRKAPEWYGEIGPALTGMRMLPNLGLSSLAPDMYRRSREQFRRQLEDAENESEEVKRLILWHLVNNN